MGPADREGHLECWALRDPVEGGPQCRAADAFASTLSPRVVGIAADCVLAPGERIDGGWYAELLSALAADPVRFLAAAGAMGTYFDRDAHTNSFAVALTRDAQDALGRALPDLSEDARAAVVAMGLSYGMEPLLGYCLPYARELDADDPALTTWARGIDPSEGLDETERWAMATGGRWNARDIMDCWDRETTGCDGWSGESPLALLEHAPTSMEPSPAPNRAVQAIRGDNLNPAEAEAVAGWLTRTSYTQREQIVSDLILEITSSERPLAIRQALARGAAGSALCDWPAFLTIINRNWAETQATLQDPTAPLTLLVEGCTASWDAQQSLQLLASAPWALLPDATDAAVRTQLTAQTAGATCEALDALSQAAIEVVVTRLNSGPLAWVEVGSLHDGVCADAFATQIVNVARNSEMHGEVRLRAIAWMLDRGDRSGCGWIAGAAAYRDVERGDAGPRSPALAAALQARCR